MADFPERLRAVYSACEPQCGFVQLAVHGYMDRWSRYGSYSLYVRDTNGLLEPKAAKDYKRPGHDLCPAGHVPVPWFYSRPAQNLLGFLTIATYRTTLRDLGEIGGREVTDIEMMVQPIFLPPNPRVEQARHELEEERRLAKLLAKPPTGPIARASMEA